MSNVCGGRIRDFFYFFFIIFFFWRELKGSSSGCEASRWEWGNRVLKFLIQRRLVMPGGYSLLDNEILI